MQFSSIADLRAFLDDAKIQIHKVAVVDIDGVLRGKTVSREKFLSMLEEGFGFCDVVVGWDVGDVLYDNGTLSGPSTGYRDAPVTLRTESIRMVPGAPRAVLALGEFGGAYETGCSRRLLERVIHAAREMGYRARGGFEYEFFVFKETPHSIREKGYRNLTPFTPGMFGYSMLRTSVHADLMREFWEWSETLGTPLEGLHTETGPGVLEAALAHAPLGEAAERAAVFKTFTKVFFQKRDLLATFMAKWNTNLPGQSGHLHLSLEDTSGKNLFFDKERGQGTDLLEHFVAGQVQLMPELLAMVAPTINSYRRLVPGFWAPTYANFGEDNRTAAVRTILAGPKGTRAEYRIGAADANPYLVAAVALASGLYGIRHKLRATPISGDGDRDPGPGAARLARDLREATELLARSEAARELFGDAFVEFYVKTREFEVVRFERQVTDYELERYFEII
ncbi:MAG: glutamine synthetase [Sorangiineae bacterium NIC37A_2]|nr:MAG: glutamine synthetase [Sorangiineae bacterium NIC37A_2]